MEVFGNCLLLIEIAKNLLVIDLVRLSRCCKWLREDILHYCKNLWLERLPTEISKHYKGSEIDFDSAHCIETNYENSLSTIKMDCHVAGILHSLKPMVLLCKIVSNFKNKQNAYGFYICFPSNKYKGEIRMCTIDSKQDIGWISVTTRYHCVCFDESALTSPLSCIFPWRLIDGTMKLSHIETSVSCFQLKQDLFWYFFDSKNKRKRTLLCEATSPAVKLNAGVDTDIPKIASFRIPFERLLDFPTDNHSAVNFMILEKKIQFLKIQKTVEITDCNGKQNFRLVIFGDSYRQIYYAIKGATTEDTHNMTCQIDIYHKEAELSAAIIIHLLIEGINVGIKTLALDIFNK